jgi:Fibronectin type III domain
MMRNVCSFLLLLFIGVGKLNAQIYPVQVTTQLVPPYSVYLTDYATPGNDRLKLVMIQKDISRPSYQVILSVSIELNGKTIMKAAGSFRPRAIFLEPGVPTVVSSIDLQPYLDARNLDFIGYNREEYERTKALPEGSYSICITASDFRRPEVIVSNIGCAFYWLSKNEPPLLNLPSCASDIPSQNLQQIVFSWLPRNTTSPNSALDTEYEFSLYEIRPADRNPNDVVLSSPPVFQSVTSATQLVYGPSEPLLLKEMSYAWRVKAIDKDGKDQFRNNGYSEVCTFTYGSIDNTIPGIEDLQAYGQAERRGKASWEAVRGIETYKVGYRKKGSDYKWFTEETDRDSLTIYELEPHTEYEVRVQCGKEGNYGPFSETVLFKTHEPKTYQCGEELPTVAEPGLPMLAASTEMIIDVQGFDLTLTEVTASSGGAGYYQGKGYVSVPYLGGATFNAVFSNLFIDENRKASSGRIDFVTKSIDNWVEEQLEQQRREELEEQQEENRDQWSGTDFYEEVTYYDDIVIGDIRVKDGKLIIEGEDALGNPKEYTNDKIIELANSTGQAVIIEDKNGDQWVVQPGGKVTKVPGGGLSPNMDVYVSEEALDIVKKALLSLRGKYHKTRMEEIVKELEILDKSRTDHINQHNVQIAGDGIGAETIGQETIEVDIEESVFLNLEITEEPLKPSNADANNEFKRLSMAYFSKEQEHNIGLLIEILTVPDNLITVQKLITPDIKINGKTVSEFVEEQKKRNVSEPEIIKQAESGIEDLLNKLLKSFVNKNIKLMKN